MEQPQNLIPQEQFKHVRSQEQIWAFSKQKILTIFVRMIVTAMKFFNCDMSITLIKLIVKINIILELLNEIFQARKEIIRKNRQRQLQCASIDSLERSVSLKQGSTIDQSELKKQMDYAYNRTLQYLQQQKVVDGYAPQTIGECQDVAQFEGGLNKELSRYNKHKIQKIREAQIKLEEDKKRVELLEKIQERDQRIVHVMTKKQQEIKEKYSTSRKVENKRMDTQEMESQSQPRENEAQRNVQQLSNNEIRSKLLMKMDDQKEKKKREQVLLRKEEFEKQIDMDCQMQMAKIQQKLENSEKMQRELIQNKIEKIKEQNLKEQQIMKQQKQLKDKISQDHINQLLEKMVQKEKDFQINQKSIQNIEQEKKIEIKQKQKKIKSNQGDVFKDRDEKLKQINEKFTKIEQFNKIKKEEQDYKILLKQELRKLKEQDKQDILERQKRQNEYRMQEITEKYRQVDEKNQLKQYQNTLLQQTSMQISKQEILQRNRIYSHLQEMSDNLFNKKVRKRNLSQLEKNVLTIKPKPDNQKEDTEFEDHTKLLITMLQTSDAEETVKIKQSRRQN
ncbi:unnamed protein product (macronuclear) [Paramecium tetraurelia]|uniref:Trichohyalin-plectin-homology domain-containing protein n=1 Tax=Paramecium tetraurelia TaxID=5888 RepID=A0CSH6_PARTE|nr:uncharacterized protein GSPATT00010015001 [Paramecium tetraurelia]CAK73743.1 unnamed protein product [Paramecium tetraurelia]|eukprot:XP_001441140.1 hypothetical protein (macronuclear) [Paramecium tetraurelia strain d4-2]